MTQHYAHITSGAVDFVLRVEPHSVFADPYASEFVPCPEGVRVGWLYDGTVFSPPVTPAPVEDWCITRLAFRNRFTQAEKVALELAALDDPAATLAQRQQAAAVRVYLSDVAAAAHIDLGRADTRAGVQALEAAGLLAPGRALQVLDAPVQPHERPLP